MFKVGQRLILVDEPGEVVVLELKSKNLILVEDEHGFTRTYPFEKLAPIRISEKKLKEAPVHAKEKPEMKLKVPKKSHNATPVVLDLHIHELVDKHENWTNTEIVAYQMAFLKRNLEKLMTERVRCVHIVHGVGEGVLRQEVRQFLSKFKNCEMNDLSYTRNGFGATEFIIRYKGNV